MPEIRTVLLTHPGGGNFLPEKTTVSVDVTGADTDQFITLQVQHAIPGLTYGLVVFSPSVAAPAFYAAQEGDSVADIAAGIVAAYALSPIAPVTMDDLGAGSYRVNLISGTEPLAVSTGAFGPGYSDLSTPTPQTIVNADEIYVLRINNVAACTTGFTATTAESIVDKFVGPGGPIDLGNGQTQAVSLSNNNDGTFDLTPFAGSTTTPFDLEISANLSTTAVAVDDTGQSAHFLLAQENPNRKSLFIQNKHASQIVYVAFGRPATTDDFEIAGKATRDWPNPPTGSINLYAAVTAKFVIGIG